MAKKDDILGFVSNDEETAVLVNVKSFEKDSDDSIMIHYFDEDSIIIEFKDESERDKEFKKIQSIFLSSKI